jgi:hypothetical protein
MNPQFDLVMSLLNVPKYAPHAWPHLTQSSGAATVYRYNRKLSGISLIKCQCLTGFAKLLVTINFKFEKTKI